jgi:hypothetical protein
MGDATFSFGDPFRGEDARLAVRYMVRALSTTTVGNMMYIGQVYRSRIRQRTLDGIDLNGASFTPYSTKGPYYFYPNRESVRNSARATHPRCPNKPTTHPRLFRGRLLTFYC